MESHAKRKQRTMSFDYTFFNQTLTRLRRLRSRISYPWYVLDAAKQIASSEDLEVAPKVIWTANDTSGETIFDTTSYAKQPGSELRQLIEYLGQTPPEDFLAFHRLYAEALVVTRSYPIHLWSEAKIVEEASQWWRHSFVKPIRFFRFGGYFDREAQHFGLWQEHLGSGAWKVAVTSIDQRDEDYDQDNIDSVYIMGNSFYDWLRDLVERDGLPDPFIEVGEAGGFFDPA